MKINFDWLRDYVDLPEEPAAVAEALTMAGLEVELVETAGTDTVLTVSVTPNRPDWLSHLGVARELAAIYRRTLRMPDCSVAQVGRDVRTVTSIAVEDPAGCPRYSGRVLMGVKVGPSPVRVRERLESLGVRSISNVVDATNYVMLELGQPLHAFDYDRLRESRIVVRRARSGETMRTLDGQDRSLQPSDLLICDGLGPVALAGVMGGLDSEVEDGTANLLLESACFDPVTIRRTGKRLGLSTEASFRFERGTDPTGTVRAIDRLARLTLEWSGGVACRGVVDAHPRPEGERTVTFSPARLNSFLGTDFDKKEVVDVLSRLDLRPKDLTAGRVEVTVPGFRRDVAREEDVFEEVARILGYDSVPVTMPVGVTVPVRTTRIQDVVSRVRGALEAMGFYDAVTYAFVDPADIRDLGLDGGPGALALKNPIAEDMAVMRTSLLPGLLNSLKLNLSRRSDEVRLYEVARVFLPCGHCELPEERLRVAAVMTGDRSPKTWYRDREESGFFDAKGVGEAICQALGIRDYSFVEMATPYLRQGQSAWVMAGGQAAGPVGTLAPSLCDKYRVRGWAGCIELDLGVLEGIETRAAYRPLPQHPSLLRDLAVVAPTSTSVEAITGGIREAATDLASLRLFDLYEGKGIETGKRSLAFALAFQDPARTLTDEEVDRSMDHIVRELERRFGASRR